MSGFAGGTAGYALGVDHTTGAKRQPEIEPFFGEHQAGIATPIQEHGVFLGFNLKPNVDRVRFAALMQLATDDAARLTSGNAALPDNDPMLAHLPARLTITFGFGRTLFTKLGLEAQLPRGFVDIPNYSIDRLEPAYSGGDVVLQICSDDPLTLSHTARQITRTFFSFARPVWTQRGFVGQAGTSAETGTPRNLFGQLDGTINPGRLGIPFDKYVWANNAGWFSRGTMLVLRRIAMNLPTWDKLDESDKEHAIGRRLGSGAPLTGSREQDPADLSATDAVGLPVIDRHAHIRRAAPTTERERFLRRPFSYDDGILEDGDPNAGLLFAAYAASIEEQYLPVQNRIASLDVLNKWTTTIGSATFVIPPGCRPGGFIGEGLLT